MIQAFDSGVDENGRLFIITTEWNEEGNRDVTKNFITVDRAKEVLKDLTLSVKKIEKSKKLNRDLRKSMF